MDINEEDKHGKEQHEEGKKDVSQHDEKKNESENINDDEEVSSLEDEDTAQRQDTGGSNNLGMNEDWSDSEDDEEDYDKQPHGVLQHKIETGFPFHDSVNSSDEDSLKRLLIIRHEKLNRFKETLLSGQEDTMQPSMADWDDPLSEKDEEGLTPLHLAILLRNLEFVRILLDAGSDLSVDCQKSSIVHLTLAIGSIPENKEFAFTILKELLQRSASFKEVDDLNRTSLHCCAEFGLTECCTYLLDEGANEIINEIDLLGRTPLHIACLVGCTEIVRLLLSRGTLVNKKDDSGYTPLHIAARAGEIGCVQELLQVDNISITTVDNYGLTPIDWADRCNYTDVGNILRQTAGIQNNKATGNFSKHDNRKTLLYSHPICVEHHTCNPLLVKNRTYSEIPSENVNRVKVLVDKTFGILRSYRVNKYLDWAEPKPVEIADILRVHEYQYIRKLKDFCESLGETDIGELDSDTTISRKSYEAARIAAGSVCDAIDRICGDKSHRNAFCAVRPPGHHAGPRGVVRNANDPHGSYGFCLLSNAAIGAAYARNVYRHDGVRKVAVIDFDVHHGNGTEACFRNVNPSTKTIELEPAFCDIKLTAPSYKPWLNERDGEEIFFASIHGYGKRIPGFDPDPKNPPHIGNFYPSSGENFGYNGYAKRNPAEPYIVNVGQNSKRRVEWRKTWQDHVLPALADFDPDLIIISAGFDAHQRDDINMGYISTIEHDYYWLTQELVKIGNLCCSGRVVSVLEGGYCIQGRVVSPFARSVCEHVAAMIETSPFEMYDMSLLEKEKAHEKETMGTDWPMKDTIQKRLEERKEMVDSRRTRRQQEQKSGHTESEDMDISEHESQQKIVDRAGNRQDSSKYDSQEDEPGAKKAKLDSEKDPQ